MQFAVIIIFVSLLGISNAANPKYGVLDAKQPIPVSCKPEGISVIHQGSALYIDVQYPLECWMNDQPDRDVRQAIDSVFVCPYFSYQR